MAATFHDILIGANQNTIKPVYVGPFSLSPGEGSHHLSMHGQWGAWDFLAVGFASVFFIGSAYVLCQSWRRSKEVAPGRLKAPLVPATSGDY